jgi:signal transduction histidine kinase
VKFTPSGGRVTVALSPEGSAIRLTVTDTGRGIEPAFLSRVFERFSQADAPEARGIRGLGIGLAIVRELVEAHGGTIEAASQGEGRGATFTTTLPGRLEAPASYSQTRKAADGTFA